MFSVSRVRYPVNMPKELYKSLQKIAEEEGLTVHAVILCALKEYVHSRKRRPSLEELDKKVRKLELAIDELRAKVDINSRRVVLLERRLRSKK
ncbi:MAG: hypothetical protein DRN04_00330 [Thermoprotei archaeon]|nr:MAG: hypothetical protein DRN04_00330 [Thermoprotei archaeon]